MSKHQVGQGSGISSMLDSGGFPFLSEKINRFDLERSDLGKHTITGGHFTNLKVLKRKSDLLS